MALISRDRIRDAAKLADLDPGQAFASLRRYPRRNCVDAVRGGGITAALSLRSLKLRISGGTQSISIYFRSQGCGIFTIAGGSCSSQQMFRNIAFLSCP